VLADAILIHSYIIKPGVNFVTLAFTMKLLLLLVVAVGVIVSHLYLFSVIQREF